MLGRKERGQLELFITGSLRGLIPDDHVLVRVDQVLDLGWLRAEVADLYCADNGRPGIDPEVAMRLMLAGFLLGIVQDRRLMREAQVNLAIRWFVGYALHEALPDHSSLTRIRHPARGLFPVDQTPQTDRRGIWLGQNRRWHGPDRLSGRRTGAFPLHPDDDCQQPRATASAVGRMMTKNRVSHTHAFQNKKRAAGQHAKPATKGNRSGPATISAPCYMLDGRRKVVAENVNAVFPTGVAVALLGRNGAGKSSMLRMISGAMLPTSGRILSSGTISWPVGFAGAFNGELTGEQNCRFIARLYGVNTDEMIEFVEDFAELGEHFRLPIRSYSSGMRARLAFGVSMAVPFDTYLVDEVSAVGDASFKAKSNRLFNDRMSNAGAIVVSHSLNMLRQTCQAGAVLENGRLSYYHELEEAIEVHMQNMEQAGA